MPSHGNLATRIATLAVVVVCCVRVTSSTAIGQQPLPPIIDGSELLPESNSPPTRRSPPTNEIRADLDRQSAEVKEQRFLVERVDAQRTLDVTIGRPTILRFRAAPFRDQVGDPTIVDVLSITETELSITGKKIGSTVLNLWFTDPSSDAKQELLSYLVRVSEDPERSRRFDILLENLERDVNRGFPNSVVDLSYVGSQVVVRGKARDIEEATHILRIVSQSLPNDNQIDQLASIIPAVSQNRSQGGLFQPNVVQPNVIQPAPFQTAEGFTIDEITGAGGLDSILRGETATGANAVRINNRIVNMLEIAGVHQVMLKVTLAEVVRGSDRSLIADARFGGGPSTDDISFTQNAGIGSLTFQTNEFFLRFDALKRLNLARSLSEPNLTTLSGQPANFLVGGQFPIVESSSTVATVNQTIRFIPFGIQLSVLPTVTDGDRIRLQLQATISETSNGGNASSVGQNNTPSNPPSLSTRSVTSTVELRDTESLALAGLIRDSLNTTSARVPFLGDIPVLGNLFSQNRTAFQEQELMVIVTPYLVSPLPAGMTPALPGSDTFEPDDLDFFLCGGIHGSIPDDYRTPVRSDLHKANAFRASEQKYIIGMPGHSSGRPLVTPTTTTHVLKEMP